MPVYEYKAKDASGQVESGMMQGASLDAVATRLAEKGLTVESLGVARSVYDPVLEGGGSLGEVSRAESPAMTMPGPPVGERSKWETDVSGPLVGTVPLTVMHMFFRQLTAMLKAGINPAQALQTLSAQQRHPKFRSILLEAMGHVEAGRPISAGFQRYPEVFSPMIMSMVRVGEEGGFLDSQCERIADYLQQDIELRNLIRRETIYPKIVFVASILIILSANAFIGSINAKAGKIPVPMWIWTAVLIAIVVWFFASRLGGRQQGIKHAWDKMILFIPGFRGVMHGFAMARFGRAFGALWDSGVAIGKSVELAADASGNEAVRAQIYPIAQRMDSGEGMTELFASTRAFSPIVLDMVKAGEMTGNVNDMLVKVAEYYEEEGKTKARQYAMIFGVVMFVAVAIYVLVFILLPFYMGYFNGITNAAGG